MACAACGPFEPVINALLQLVASLLLAAGGWLIARPVHWLGLKNAAQATANLDDALQKAIAYGLQQVQDTIREKGWDHIDVRDRTLAIAPPYLITRFPDALRAVGGLDLSNRKAAEIAVSGALDRAFPQAADTASPATPPRTAPVPPTQAGLAEPNPSLPGAPAA